MEKIIQNGVEYYSADAVQKIVQTEVEKAMQPLIHITEKQKEKHDEELSQGVRDYILSRSGRDPLGGRDIFHDVRKDKVSAGGPLGGREI